MLSKMGYAGKGLGKDNVGSEAPLVVTVKEDRAGIGVANPEQRYLVRT